MGKYVLRLDDACEKIVTEKWTQMELILDQYKIKPLVGVIPKCEDPEMDGYTVDLEFWKRVDSWRLKGWSIGMHGYNHVYSTNCGGMNPVNYRSEFAGVSYSVQKEKISKGIAIMKDHGFEPEIFIAPSHTFDKNTLAALKEVSEIRIVSDTIAFDSYCKDDFFYVPQQSGKARRLPFKVITFCYHPNKMNENDFCELKQFLQKYSSCFVDFKDVLKRRNENLVDLIIRKAYFLKRAIKI